jgi:ribosome biogenesis GTPase A
MASKQITKLLDWKEFAAKFQGKTYQFPNNLKVNWFPGHMVKGLRQMQHTLLKTDCVVEVHDARIPLSGRNISFKNHITGNRPHILVLNKQDLAFGSSKRKSSEHSSALENKKLEIKNELMRREPELSDVIFCSCSDLNSTLKAILPNAIDLIQKSDRYHRASRPDSNIMIIGVPNVGKSSLINHIRRGNLRIKNNAVRVGNMPGVTRTLENKVKVSEDPLVYLLDTPGIMMPNIKVPFKIYYLSIEYVVYPFLALFDIWASKTRGGFR